MSHLDVVQRCNVCLLAATVVIAELVRVRIHILVDILDHYGSFGTQELVVLLDLLHADQLYLLWHGFVHLWVQVVFH